MTEKKYEVLRLLLLHEWLLPPKIQKSSDRGKADNTTNRYLLPLLYVGMFSFRFLRLDRLSTTL